MLSVAFFIGIIRNFASLKRVAFFKTIHKLTIFYWINGVLWINIINKWWIKKVPFHKMCPANCKIYAGQDPRCPCSAYPLHPSCPPNCESYAGKDKRCPCSEFPLHKNCPPNCDVYTGKEYYNQPITFL